MIVDPRRDGLNESRLSLRGFQRKRIMCHRFSVACLIYATRTARLPEGKGAQGERHFLAANFSHIKITSLID